MVKRGFQLKRIRFNWKKPPRLQISKSKRGIKKLKILIFLLVLPITAYAIKNYSSTTYKIAYGEMKNLKVLPEAERFTELYFPKYDTLPHIAAEDQKIDFSFSIRNLEEDDCNYKYLVYYESNNSKISIDSGNVEVRKSEVRTIEESYIFKQKYEEGKVVVELPDKNQRIHFHLTPLIQLIKIAHIN